MHFFIWKSRCTAFLFFVSRKSSFKKMSKIHPLNPYIEVRTNSLSEARYKETWKIQEKKTSASFALFSFFCDHRNKINWIHRFYWPNLIIKWVELVIKETEIIEFPCSSSIDVFRPNKFGQWDNFSPVNYSIIETE